MSYLQLPLPSRVQAGLGACLLFAFLTTVEVQYCHATCGDYLMPLHSNPGAVNHGVVNHGVFMDGYQIPDRKTCHGPGCGNAPESESGFAVALSTNPHQLTLAAATDSPGVCPQLPCVGSLSFGPSLRAVSMQAELFRPPRCN